MEHVKAANHGWFVHERKLIDSPWDSTKLGIHLDENLGDDGAEILTSRNGTCENNLGRNRVLSQEEALDVVVESVLTFCTRQDKDNHLDSIVELLLKLTDPCVSFHARSDCIHLRLITLETNLIETLLHSALELVGCLCITVTVEDTPALHAWLGKHFGLDLAIEVTSTPLDVELIRSTRGCRTHDEVAGVVLVALKLSRVVRELEMPLLLLLLALLILSECLEKTLALLDLLFSVGVHDLGKVLHETEVSSHDISEACELT